MALSFEDSVRELVKKKLDPATEDAMTRKAAAEAAYFGDPNVIEQKYANVWDPKERMKLVDQAKQINMSSVNSLSDILANREGSISDVVDAFARARAEDTANEKEAWARNMDMQNLALERARVAISQQEANSNAGTDDLAQLTQLYGPEIAKRILAAKLTGSNYPTIAGILPKTADELAAEAKAKAEADAAAAKNKQAMGWGLGGAGTGALIGSAIAPGIGTLAGAGIGYLAGSMGGPSGYAYLRSLMK